TTRIRTGCPSGRRREPGPAGWGRVLMPAMLPSCGGRLCGFSAPPVSRLCTATAQPRHTPATGRAPMVVAMTAAATLPTRPAAPSPVLAYCDVDLSTDLAALLPLVAPLISGHSDLAIGTRLGRGSRVVRGMKREVISRGYNLLLRGTLAVRFSDAQCGFKA